MPFILVRDARNDDEAVIALHRESSANEARQFRGTLALFDEDDIVVQFTLIATILDVVVGSCTLALRGDKAFLSHIYVDPEARRVGVGDSLMREALARAASLSDSIEALALPGDRETKNLFERHGLTAQTIVVGRVLEN